MKKMNSVVMVCNNCKKEFMDDIITFIVFPTGLGGGMLATGGWVSTVNDWAFFIFFVIGFWLFFKTGKNCEKLRDKYCR